MPWKFWWKIIPARAAMSKCPPDRRAKADNLYRANSAAQCRAPHGGNGTGHGYFPRLWSIRLLSSCFPVSPGGAYACSRSLSVLSPPRTAGLRRTGSRTAGARGLRERTAHALCPGERSVSVPQRRWPADRNHHRAADGMQAVLGNDTFKPGGVRETTGSASHRRLRTVS